MSRRNREMSELSSEGQPPASRDVTRDELQRSRAGSRGPEHENQKAPRQVKRRRRDNPKRRKTNQEAPGQFEHGNVMDIRNIIEREKNDEEDKRVLYTPYGKYDIPPGLSVVGIYGNLKEKNDNKGPGLGITVFYDLNSNKDKLILNEHGRWMIEYKREGEEAFPSLGNPQIEERGADLTAADRTKLLTREERLRPGREGEKNDDLDKRVLYTPYGKYDIPPGLKVSTIYEQLIVKIGGKTLKFQKKTFYKLNSEKGQPKKNKQGKPWMIEYKREGEAAFPSLGNTRVERGAHYSRTF